MQHVEIEKLVNGFLVWFWASGTRDATHFSDASSLSNGISEIIARAEEAHLAQQEKPQETLSPTGNTSR